MLLKVIVGGAVVILAVAIFAGRPHFKRYRIPSASMEPTIREGEIVNLNGGEEPNVGDIVILDAPQGAEGLEGTECGEAGPGGLCARPTPQRSPTKLIKRIVAGPGDQVAFRRGQTIRNGKPVEEPYVMDCGGGEACDFPEPVTVPDGMYYLVGDNRGASDDSRFWGPVPEDWILGRVERCSAIYFFCSPA